MSELRWGNGVHFFPVTPFDDSGAVDPGLLGALVERGLEHGPGSVFAACGTGEFHALDSDEHRQVIEATVAATAGHVPVIGGAGGPLGHAIRIARAAEDAGADGLLILPPYLVQGPQEGLLRYVEAIANATSLPLIVYHRDNAKLTGESVAQLTQWDSVIGLKDGVGDLDLARRFVEETLRTRPRFLFFNGLPTAELHQAEFTAIGIPFYSSAVFAIAPEVANAFFRASRRGDDVTQRRLLDGFYCPLVELRDECPGFAVSLIKAGLRLTGSPVGSVRPPLIDPDLAQTKRLGELLAAGLELI